MDVSMKALSDYKIRTKKVSINVDIQMLELIDDLQKILKSNRTIVFMSLLGLGVPGFIKSMRADWESARKTNPERKEKIDALLSELSKIEDKHVKKSY